jgi:septal ring factor EnvC (AmiA/AmiB activator)
MNKQQLKVAALSAVLASGAIFSATAAANVDKVLQVTQTKATEGAASQKRIDGMADDTRKLLNEYKETMKQVDGLKVYNAKLQKQISNQEESIKNYDESIKQVVVMQRQMLPLTERMLDSLEQFIALDMPFKLVEREDMINRLRANVENPKFSTAEKFRQVLEAYKIENEYGRRIAEYSASFDIDGTGEREVNILQIGRVALLAQSKDEKTSAAYDKQARQWVVLTDSDYKNSIIQGLRIARKQAAQDIMLMPISAPEAAQ